MDENYHDKTHQPSRELHQVQEAFNLASSEAKRGNNNLAEACSIVYPLGVQNPTDGGGMAE